MTKTEIKKLKQTAQKAMKENGYKVQQTNITLLECGSYTEDFLGEKLTVYDYIMFTDRKTGRTFQCNYGAKHYNHEKGTLWAVYECDDYGCRI